MLFDLPPFYTDPRFDINNNWDEALWASEPTLIDAGYYVPREVLMLEEHDLYQFSPEEMDGMQEMFEHPKKGIEVRAYHEDVHRRTVIEIRPLTPCVTALPA